MEDAKVDKGKNEDSCSATKLQAGPPSSTSFGRKAEPPTLPRRNDVLVDKGAAAPKPRLSPVEMHTLTDAGNLLWHSLYRDEDHLLPATSLVMPTEEIHSGTPSIQYATYSSFWKLKVLQTKTLGVRSWRLCKSSTRLPVSGSVARVA